MNFSLQINIVHAGKGGGGGEEEVDLMCGGGGLPNLWGIASGAQRSRGGVRQRSNQASIFIDSEQLNTPEAEGRILETVG